MARLSKEHSITLISLAARNGATPNGWWRSDIYFGTNKKFGFVCYICLQTILAESYADAILEVNQHGFFHLKEHNLLPLF